MRRYLGDTGSQNLQLTTVRTFHAAASLLTILLLFFPHIASAELPALVDLRSQFKPAIQREAGSENDVQVSSYRGTINIPIALGKSTFLVPSLYYKSDITAHHDVLENADTFYDFHAVGLSALAIQLLPEKWVLTLRLSSSIAGDFSTFDSGMLAGTALLMATKPVSESLTLGASVIASVGFGKFTSFPGILVIWKPDTSFVFDGYFPAFANAKWIASKDLELGLRTELDASRYAVRDKSVIASEACSSSRSECIDNISSLSVMVGGQASYRLFGSIWISSFVGRTAYTRFEQNNADGDPISGGLQGMSETWVARAGLAWRISNR